MLTCCSDRWLRDKKQQTTTTLWRNKFWMPINWQRTTILTHWMDHNKPHLMSFSVLLLGLFIGVSFNAWCYKDLGLRFIGGHHLPLCLSPASGFKVLWNPCLYESFSQHNSQRPLNYVQLLQLLQLALATLYLPIFPASDNYPSMSKSSKTWPPSVSPPSNHRVFNYRLRAHCLWLVAEKQHWEKKKKNLISTPCRKRVCFKLYLE